MRFVFSFLCFLCFCNPLQIVQIGKKSFKTDIAEYDGKTLTILQNCKVQYENDSYNPKVNINFYLLSADIKFVHFDGIHFRLHFEPKKSLREYSLWLSNNKN